eukprot:Ihof_evm3s243 gene=Ihof_evmTU3s243
MAKWGEGDPRWIVEEREDATNVNNWHWTEKNCTPWSKKCLGELFGQEIFLTDLLGKVATDNVVVTGEATTNNRKGKLIFFYELTVKFDWKATTPGGDVIEGSVEVPNLSDEFEPDEMDVRVSVKKENEIGRKLKELMRKKGAEVVKQKIATYLKDLKIEYSKDIIKPTHKAVESNKGMSRSASVTSDQGILQQASQGVQIVPTKKDSTAKAAVSTSTIEDTMDFKCSKEDAYKVLTEPARVQAWAQSQVNFDTKVGGAWSLFGGNVQGKFVELVPYEKIAMTWREQSWPAGHVSNVVFEFKQGDSSTVVSLKQT